MGSTATGALVKASAACAPGEWSPLLMGAYSLGAHSLGDATLWRFPAGIQYSRRPGFCNILAPTVKISEPTGPLIATKGVWSDAPGGSHDVRIDRYPGQPSHHDGVRLRLGRSAPRQS